MSENLKRAESLFNRIMNQNKPEKPVQRNRKHRLEDAKRSPLREGQAAAAAVPEQHHVLPFTWTMWHHRKAKRAEDEEAEAVQEDDQNKAAAAVDLYLLTTKEIQFDSLVEAGTTSSIASVEQLWLLMLQLKRAYDMNQMTQLLVFKTGVTPVWEDPVNAKGGRWVFRFGRRLHPGQPGDAELSSRVRQRTTLIWERLVLRTLTGLLIPDKQLPRPLQDAILSDITGLALLVRREEDIILMWNLNLHFGRRPRDDDDRKRLQPFQARRIMCDAILRIIRECDLILQGSDVVETSATGSTERVAGVLFEYRLHADSNNTVLYGERRRRHEGRERQQV